MRRFKFEKLVRDNILDSMLENPDQDPKYRILDNKDYLKELKRKLIEEVEELQTATEDEEIEEIADIYEILSYIKEILKVNQNLLDKIIEDKHKKIGGFNKRAYIEYNDVEDGNEWIEKYREQPHKYPEIQV